MVLQYFIIIQFIHCIPGGYDHIWLMASFQEIQILIDRICSPPIPISVFCSDRGRKYIQPTLLSPEIPPFGRIKMLIQRPRIILRQYSNFLNMGIRHITQCKINCPVAGCNGHRRNRPFRGQSLHPPVVAACQNDSYCPHARSPAFINISPLGRTPPI